MSLKSVKMAATCGLALAAVAGAAEADTRIVANCFFPPQHFNCQEVLKAWGDEVERVTEDRVRVNIPAKSMAPPPEQLASVRGGVFDAGFLMNGFAAEELVGSGVALQPFTGTLDARANSVAYWRTYERFIALTDEFDGVHLLGLFVAPGADFYSMTDTPIQSFGDMQNMKMWALPGVTSDILKAVGSAVVSGPAVQMTETIQRGVVDGFVGIPASDAVAFNVLPYAKSLTQTDRKIFTPAFSFFVNEDLWSVIAPADQEAIMSVSGEAFAELAGGVWARAEEEALSSMGEVELVAASDEFKAELEAAAQPFIDQWIAAASAEGIDAEAALEFYRSTVTELSE